MRGGRAFLHTIASRIGGVLRRGVRDADFDQELAAHLEMAEEEGRRRGLSREDARRAARVELGGVSQLREARRRLDGLPWIEGFGVDLALGVRLLRKHWQLTLVSTASLAIAIAIVGGFHAGTEFMIDPTLPVPQGDRVVAIWNVDTATMRREEQTAGDMLAWRERLTTVEDVGAFVLQERVVDAGEDGTRLVRAAEISPAAFRMLRIPPLRGRALQARDEQPGQPAVALIGFDLWQRAFRGDDDAIGMTIGIGGIGHVIVGVMPDGFAFPRREQLWTPLRVPASALEPGDGPRVDFSIGRLAPGVSLSQADAELLVVGAQLAAARPERPADRRPRITAYAKSFLDANEPGLAMMMRAARLLIGIVLLVVAVNVGTLVYARNATRMGEVGMRMALGASRRRIAVQMFAEALVLSMTAAAVAIAVMAVPLMMLRAIFSTAADQGNPAPFWFDVRIGADTLLVIAALALVSAVLTGVLPALKLTGRSMQPALQRLQGGSSGLRFGSTATVIVVFQVTLSVALLTIGGSQLRGFVESWRAFQEEGRAREEYAAAELRWDLSVAASPDAAAADAARRTRTRQSIGRQLAAEPDVRGVTFDRFLGVRPFAAEPPRASGETAHAPWTYLTAIEPNYFEVHAVLLVAGRPFEAVDVTDGLPRIAIVNEAFARAALPAAGAVGERIRPVDPRSGRLVAEPMMVVGVVRDVLTLEISERGPGWVATPTIYVPLAATPPSAVRMSVHAPQAPGAITDRMRAIAAAADPTLVLHQAGPIEAIDPISLVFVRLYWFGAGFFVFAVLLLATAGVYSMLSFTVTQRTREIGIRTALGAGPRRVVADVLSRPMLQLGVGTGVGLVLSVAAAKGPLVLSDDPFTGPEVMVGVAMLMGAMGLLACGRPIRRALRIQPTEALRAAGS